MSNVGAGVSRWDHFLSLNNCEVKKLKGGKGYKYVITKGSAFGQFDHFGYGHLFDHVAANPTNIKGDLVLIEMDNILPKQYAIIQNIGPPLIGIGPVSGTATYDGNVYTITSSVQQDEVLGNIGRSKAPGQNYLYQHVHVYMFKDINLAIADHRNARNDRDPLEVISHLVTSYTVALSTDNNIDNNNIVTSSGENAISIKTRYTMVGATSPPPPDDDRFNNVVMDIDNVDLFIKHSHEENEPVENWGSTGSKYQLIRGEFVDSHLSHGARLYSNIYPVIADPEFPYGANPPTNTAIDIVDKKYGSFTRTGIDPFAYREDGNQPYDDYYFSDFYTRVVDDYKLGDNHVFAPCNEKAKYHDDKYHLYAKVVTVRDDVFTTLDDNADPTEIIIDNFRPFIQKVEISKIPGGQPVYSRAWSWNGNTYLFEPAPINPGIKTNNNLYVKVFSSEPMDEVSMEINDHAIPSTGQNNANNEWSFTILDNQLVLGNNIFEIDGNDLALNAMINDPPYIPIRQQNGVWLPDPAPFTGADIEPQFFREWTQ